MLYSTPSTRELFSSKRKEFIIKEQDILSIHTNLYVGTTNLSLNQCMVTHDVRSTGPVQAICRNFQSVGAHVSPHPNPNNEPLYGLIWALTARIFILIEALHVSLFEAHCSKHIPRASKITILT